MYHRCKKILTALLCTALALCLSGCASSVLLSDAGGTAAAPSATFQPIEINTVIPAAPEEDTPSEEPAADEGLSGTDAQIQALLAGMTLEEKVSQMFFVSFDCLTGLTDSNIAGDVTRQALQDFPVGGVALFAGNIDDPEQLSALTEGLQTLSDDITGLPLLISLDEEGGTVTRIAQNSAFGITDVGPMSAIGSTGDTDTAYEAGSFIGSYLAQYGFNMDFAPDADVLTNPENTVIGSRSFGSDAQLVSAMAQAYYNGLASQGIHGCLKHFPGHGATAADTHDGMSYTDKTLDELMQNELIPFIDGIEYGADSIMVAHISLPSVTGDYTPASLSPDIVTGLLREELGYDGLILTDALNMGAVADYYTPGQAAVAAVQAGADMLLFSDDALDARQAVLDAVNDDTISEQRIDESVTRILRLKLGL